MKNLIQRLALLLRLAELHDRHLGRSTPGEAAPELQGGEWLNVEEGRVPQIGPSAGGPVLIEFWSEDCPPCRNHIDVIQRVQAGYAGQ